MKSESVGFPVVSNQTTDEDELADFSTNRRVLLLSAMALAIGAFSALVAYALIWLIAAITNLAFYHRFSAAPVTPQGHQFGILGRDGAGGWRAHHRIDGTFWFGKNSRPRHS